MKDIGIEFYFGIFFVAAGLFSVMGRMLGWKIFWKLEPMKRAFGPRSGPIIHIFQYTVLPLILGIYLIVRNTWGR